MQISQTFNIVFFFFIIMPQYFYQRFTDTLPGTILHIGIALIYRAGVKCISNILDINTSNYCKRNSIFFYVLSIYWGYKYHSTFHNLTFSKVYPTLRTFIFNFPIYVIKIHNPIFSWCHKVSKKLTNNKFSKLRTILRNKVIANSRNSKNYEDILYQNLYRTIIIVLYIVSISESHKKMEIFSKQIRKSIQKATLLTTNQETNEKLLLRTIQIFGLILESMNKVF